MIVSIIRKEKIQKYDLPSRVEGSFCINDEIDKANSINIEALNGVWLLKKSGIKLLNESKLVADIALSEHQFYFLQLDKEEETLILYCAPNYDSTFRQLLIKQNCEINIGSDDNNQIVFKNKFVSPHHAKLTYDNGIWNIQDLDSKYLTYVNNGVMFKKNLIPGDIIFLMGLKLIITGQFIIINNPNNQVSFNNNYLSLYSPPLIEIDEADLIVEEDEIKLYDEADYFLSSPRLRTNVEKVTVKIDPPPAKEQSDDMPILFTVGPMITMGMISLVMGGVALNNVINGQQTLGSALPTLVISAAMLISMGLWPLLTKRWQKRKEKQKEAKRQKKYNEYIDSKRKDIENAINLQKNILNKNHIPLDKCADIIMAGKENLWERKIEEDDFLYLRIGKGSLLSEINIDYPEKQFSLDEDNLRENLDKLVNEAQDVHDVPICLSLTERYKTAVVGDDLLVYQFINGLILQLMTFHGYDDLKIIFFTDEQNESKWEYLKILPHCWTDDKEMRFFATSTVEMQQISSYLESILNSRRYKNTSSELEESNLTYENFSTYYILITDNLKLSRNIKIFKDILDQKVNCGFSLLLKHDKLSNLPNDCSTFIDISEKQSGLFENQLNSNNLKGFHADFNITNNMQECATKLANIPIELSIDRLMLPNAVTFLEMYDIGKIEQLNILERWRTSNPVISLQAPVGIDEVGEPFKLDLHEKFHGPHGLVAGMTGSGKSEFIITYILSLAVNFHPNEVSFILIDYKGGGLSGAFENLETGLKLPHLAGSITNLDTVEMKRSLVSIESELKRRQRIFNEARDKTDESTIDIYKYQRLYREGIVDTPVSHLFIISDEFAELKAQQPDFMDQLISTARIGRSLGIHLILATQKPSGVVDDQIWSNSRFRVCLKVQEKSDSMDMIKCSDAAFLKEVGRFYLQVGYNEIFALGQSAWCGSQYTPMDKRKTKVDTSINVIDNTGYVIRSVDNKKRNETNNSYGEELTVLVKFLNDIANKENIKTAKLWLDKIPSEIYVDNLKKKYKFTAQPYVINPVIGEYDDPSNQKQGLLTLDLTNDGNTVIYGTTGSGKEIMLTTIIYSIILEHSAEEVNFYIMDLGSETLGNFKKAPQVADVVFINDSEKIDNLFKLLKSTVEKRRKLFLDYNGDYRLYCQKSGDKLPLIVVIINYYEAFSEIYEQHEDIILQLTREGPKYGIIFIFSTSGANFIRYRLLQNFSQQLTLQLNDEGDYSTILGNVGGTFPSKIKGRGLVKMENIYEFQTAYPYNLENMTEYIKVICRKLRDNTSIVAEKIPILPEIVNKEFVKEHINELTDIPIGVEKASLKLLTYDLKTKYGTLILGQEVLTVTNFVTSLIKSVLMIKDINVAIFDAENIIEDKGLKKLPYYYKTKFNNPFSTIFETIEEQYELYQNNDYSTNCLENYKHTVCFIIGINKFTQKLSSETADKFDNLFEKGKHLENISFILIDSVDQVKTCEYNEWFKTSFTTNNGIWVGNGISEQFTLKLGRIPKDLYEELEDDFGYYIKNGFPTLLKLINFISDEDNEEAELVKIEEEEIIINNLDEIEIIEA